MTIAQLQAALAAAIAANDISAALILRAELKRMIRLAATKIRIAQQRADLDAAFAQYGG